MNCSNVLAVVGQVVDGTIPEDIFSGFRDHIASCASCRRAYELELVAKSLVQSSVPRIATPPDVRRLIFSSIQREAERASRPWGVRVFSAVPAPAYAFAAAAALLVYLFFPSQHTSLDDMIRHAGERDVMQQVASTFEHIRHGRMKPSITTCSPENMHAYLVAQDLPFEALVRPLDQCDGYSAVVNEYDGVKLAHIMYTIGNDIVYVYQVRKDETLSENGHLTLPPAAEQAILQTGWYTDPEHPDCNVVVWEEAGTLCAATSTMPKTKMLALLATR